MRGASRRCRGVSRYLELAVACVCSVTLLASAPALAQSDETRATARAAATAGATAFDEGKWNEAIDLFTRAESIVHAPPHLLFIARSYVKLNRLVRAKENYLKITREPLLPSAPRAFADAQAAANTEAAALDSRIPTINIVVEGAGAADATVMMDGSKVISGVTFPVDPGAHVLVARTKDQASEETSVTVAEATQQTFTLALHPSAQATGAVPKAGPQAGDGERPGESGGTSGVRVASYIGIGIGVVGVAAGSVFLAQNHSRRDEAQKLCVDARCPESQRATVERLDSDGDSASTLSWIGFGVGAVGLAAGGTLLALSLMSSSKTHAAHSVEVRPVVGSSYLGLSGSF